MNKVIEADSGFLNLEVAILTKHCPMTSDMLFALLCFRGDISRNDFKEVEYFIFLFLFLLNIFKNFNFKEIRKLFV